MTEPSLTLGYGDFSKEVGHLIGWGRDTAAYTTDQASIISDIIASGLRQFYFPAPIQPEVVGHQWSFLSPAAELTLADATSDYDLPDDYGSLRGEITYQTETGLLTVHLTSEGAVRVMRQANSDSSGRPVYAAIRPKAKTTTASVKWEILFYPTPDSAYVLDYRYNVLPNKISTTDAYPYGGAAYSECILQSCLAVAEERANGQPGAHLALFKDLLNAAISVDSRATGASGSITLGYNGDRSDGYALDRRHVNDNYVSYKDATY